MLDKNAFLRDGSTALTATEASAPGVDTGQDLVPQTYFAVVPAATGTLTLKIQESDDNSTWRDLATFENITTAGVYYVTAKSNARYRRYHATVATGPFGNVIVGFGHAGRYNKW